MTDSDEWPKGLSHTCLWYVSFEQQECGKPAAHLVRAKAFVIALPGLASRRQKYTIVPLCEEHKKIHDENFTRRRAAVRRASS